MCTDSHTHEHSQLVVRESSMCACWIFNSFTIPLCTYMSTVRVYGTFVGPSPEFSDLPFDESVVLDAYEYTLQGEHLKRVRFGTADTIHVNHPWNGRRTVKFLEKSNMHTHSHTHIHIQRDEQFSHKRLEHTWK